MEKKKEAQKVRRVITLLCQEICSMSLYMPFIDNKLPLRKYYVSVKRSLNQYLQWAALIHSVTYSKHHIVAADLPVMLP